MTANDDHMNLPTYHARLARARIDQVESAISDKQRGDHEHAHTLAVCAQAEATLAVAAALDSIARSLSLMADKPTFRG
ncbi:hypothetical protein [Nonomuraea sp. NPDC049625]|uniref:hypothetical protein n=1 Tax=Nonomuraea sp. NPDC049625 TaxID=3155775 RepID=UPI00342AD172